MRIVTGDHIETAKKMALDAKILKPEEVNVDGVALTGDEFRRRIGDFETVYD